MRNNGSKGTKKNLTIDILRFAILALCFVIAFGFAFSSDSSLFSDVGDVNGGIANADDVEGSTNRFSGDAEISPDLLNGSSSTGFPGTVAGERSWTQTVTTAKTVFNKSNVSVFMQSGTSVTLMVEERTGHIYFRESDKHGIYNPDIYAAINYSPSQFLNNLLTFNTNVKVVAKVQATMQRDSGTGAGTDAYGMYACASNKALSGEELKGSDKYDKVVDNWLGNLSATTKTFSKDVELTAANPYLAISFYDQVGHSAQCKMTVRDISITFTVTMEETLPGMSEGTRVHDYASPILSDFANVEPYRHTVEEAAQWPVYNSVVAPHLHSAIDTLDTKGLKSNLYSYTNKPLSNKNGKAYYKKASMNFVDAYNYDMKGAIVGDSLDARYAAGIKRFIVGQQVTEGGTQGAVLNVYESSSGKTIYVDNVAVGWAEIRWENRARYWVDIYMYTNAVVDVVCEDAGDLKTTKKLDVRGIDTTNPVNLSLSTGEGYASLADINSINGFDWNSIKWQHESVLEIDADPNFDNFETSDFAAPYAWYYSVQKSADGKDFTLPAEYTKEQILAMTPFAAKNLSMFSYDFVRGSSGGIANGTSAEQCVGAGYYLFTFYAIDFAGNYDSAQHISYYVKADYEKPAHEVSLTNPNGYQITAQNNGEWSRDELKVTINLLNGESLAGNIFVFPNMDLNEHTIAVYQGKIVFIDENLADTNSGQIEGVYYQYISDDTGDRLELIYGRDLIAGADLYNDIDIIAEYKVYVGNDLYAETLVEDFDSGWEYQEGSATRKGVRVRVDRNVPDAVVLENEYLMDGNNGNSMSVPDRLWYTDGSVLPTSITFSDALIEYYGKEIKIYIGLKYQGFAKGFEDVYKELASSQYNGYFTSLAVLNSDTVDGNSKYDLNLLQIHNAGLRSIYVWAVDQAGNVSDLEMFYILADWNTYRVSVNFDSGIFEETVADGVLENSSGVAAADFKRGETVNFIYDLDFGYIPYRFNMNYYVNNTDRNSVNMLSNSSMTQYFNVVEDDFKNYVVPGNSDTNVELVLDRDSLTALSANSGNYQTIEYEFSFRKTIEYTITNYRVPYSGAATSVPMTVTDENARSAFVFEFKDANGTLLDAPPVIPGEYQVSISLDNQSYVALALTDLSYSIINRTATVTVTATNSVYGTAPELKYTISNLAQADAEKLQNGELDIIGSLKLNVADAIENYRFLSVGGYAVIADTPFSLDYYDLQFVGAMHTVNPKTLNAAISPEQSKVYGDPDPAFRFTVSAGDFVGSDTADKIFLNLDDWSQDGNIVTLTTSRYIQRVGGESAGEYGFISDTSDFELNPNYIIELNATAVFRIEKRVITLNVPSGQFAMVPDSEYDIAAFGANFALSPADYKYLSYIEGALALANKSAGISTENYDVDLYDIVTGTLQSKAPDDIEFVLPAETVKFEIRIVIGDKTVIITKNSDFRFEKSYGIPWNNREDAQFLKDNFTVTGLGEYDETWNYSISWLADLPAGIPQTPNAAIYNITVSDVVILDAQGGDVTSQYVVQVIPFTVEITPIDVVISAIYEGTSKTYGDLDSLFGIGYEIKSVGEWTDPQNGFINFNVVYDSLNGAFARAKFNADGGFIAIGSQFDSATDASGAVLDGSGNYYGLFESVKFTSRSNNYNIIVETDKDVRFTVDKKIIELTANDFKGISKRYDGTDNVDYGHTVPVDLSGYLLSAQDSLWLAYSARYDGVEIANHSIVFSDLSLDGASAINYALYMEGENLAEATGYRFSIRYIDANAALLEEIRIFGQIASFRKADFALTKQYDGTTAITADNLLIAGTNSFAALNKILGETYNFSQTGVTSNFSIAKLVVFFPMDNPGANVSVQPVAGEDDIEIHIIEGTAGRAGVEVIIYNIQGSITERVIAPENLATVYAVDRDYNGNASVEIGFSFADGALAVADAQNPASIGLRFGAEAVDKNAGALDGRGAITKTNVNFTSAEVGNRNYTVDVDAFKNYFSGARTLTVAIARAKLMPNVEFSENKVYNGLAAVNKTSDLKYMGGFTTLNFADELASELVQFELDWDAVTLTYSLNGIADKNVAYRDDEVIKHNVLVSGLIVTENGGNDYLRNYVLYGSEYDAQAKEYVAKSSAIVSGDVISDYEMLEIAVLDRIVIAPKDNNITVKDKIYDGTKNAEYEVIIEELIDSEMDKVGIEFDTQFYTANVGERIRVTLSNGRLYSKNNIIETQDGKIEIDYAKNYVIRSDYFGVAYKNITPAPVVVNAKLDTKTYDGKISSNVNGIEYTLEGIYDFDKNSYRLVISNAFFADKNAGENKPGYVYGLSLSNISNRNVINYKLAYRTEEMLQGDNAPAPLDVRKENGTDWYYYPLKTLNTYVSAADYDKEKHGDILGTYLYNNKIIYFIDSSTASESKAHALVLPLNYIESTGTIEKKSVRISVELGEGKEPNKGAYAKTYDGTTAFNGVFGVDYRFTGDLGGIIEGDELEPAKDEEGNYLINAAYQTASAGATQVVFSISSLAGKDIGNYNVDRAVSRIAAVIRKAVMDVKLLDDSVTYGSPKNVYDKVEFSINGKPVLFSEGYMYAKYNDYLEIFPEIAKIVEQDKTYLNSRRYNNVEGEYVSNEAGSYVRLAGTFVIPTGDKNAINALTPVGDYDYTLKGGSSNNFDFNFTYTGNGSRGNSKLTVDKATLYVYASNAEYSKVYGESNPSINLKYSDGPDSDANGFKNGHNPYSVFGSNAPKAQFRIHNGEDFTDTVVPDNALLPADLKGRAFYGVYIDLQGVSASNYDVVLRFSDIDKISRLDITLPTIDNVSVINKSVTFNGDNMQKQVLRGTTEVDKVTFKVEKKEGNDWIKVEDDNAVNVGEYRITAKVTRPISDSPSGSEKEYTSVWEGEALLTITPATLGMSTETVTVTYNFGNHEFSKKTLTFICNVGLNLDDIKMSYQREELEKDDVSGTIRKHYKNVDSISDVGTYRIVLVYDPEDIKNQTLLSGNFLAETAYIDFIVTPVTLKVTVDPASQNQLFVSEEETHIEYSLAYTEEFAHLNVPLPATDVLYMAYNNSSATQEETSIHRPGKYTYIVKLTEFDNIGNYALIGDYTGVFEVGCKQIESVSSSNSGTGALLNTVGEATILADVLTCRVIGSKNDILSDDAYWGLVSNMAARLGSDDVPANVKSIVFMNLKYNGNEVRLASDVNMSVEIPSGVKIKDVEVYYVTANGGLAKLTDYTVSDGKINYTVKAGGQITSLVFVKFGNELPAWGIALIVIGSVAAAAGIAAGIVFAVKKKKRAHAQ